MNWEAIELTSTETSRSLESYGAQRCCSNSALGQAGKRGRDLCESLCHRAGVLARVLGEPAKKIEVLRANAGFR